MRPTKFEEIIGQKPTIEKLKILIKASKIKNAPIPHVLFAGPAGTGKTTLARVMAEEMEQKFVLANAASIKNISDAICYLDKIEGGTGVLFIDEIHSLPHSVCEFLYTVMEDFRYDVPEGSRDLPGFTLIGATTHAGMIPAPMRSRFKHIEILDEYTPEELTDLVIALTKSKMTIKRGIAEVIAKTCRGNPRHITNRVDWIIDYLMATGETKLSSKDAIRVIEMQGVDRFGLTSQDRDYIDTLFYADEHTMSIRNLSSKLDIVRETIENEIEPYLIRLGLVLVGTKGRVLNIEKYKIFGGENG